MPVSPSTGRRNRQTAPIGAPEKPVVANQPIQQPRWTFLTNHSHVLLVLAKDQAMVLREVAARVGITERAVQRIIAELEEGGFIVREKIGRQNRYRIRRDHRLRHPIEQHCTIGELLNLILQKS